MRDTAKDVEMGQIQDSPALLRLHSSKGDKNTHIQIIIILDGLAVGSAVESSDGGDYFLLGSSVGAVEGDGPGWMGTIKNWPYSSMGGFSG